MPKPTLPPRGAIDAAWAARATELAAAGVSLARIDSENPRTSVETAFGRWRWAIGEAWRWRRIARNRRDSARPEIRARAGAARADYLEAREACRRARAHALRVLEWWRAEEARRSVGGGGHSAGCPPLAPAALSNR